MKGKAKTSLLRSSWFLAFVSVAVLVLAQIGWWAYVFVHEVQDSAAAHRHNVLLSTELSELQREARLKSIDHDFLRRRNMFVSESLFFAVLTCIGLALLFRALRSERKAQEQEKSFIEIVTHESKTPLTALKLRLESIVEQWAGVDPSLNRELDLAQREVLRLVQVVEKTVNLNRLEREGLTLRPLCLTEVVRDSFRRLEPFLKSKEASVELKLEEEVWIYADAPSIATTLQNLLENAVVHNSSTPPQIAVTLQTVGKEICLRISDNGPGIAAHERHDIFERFHRGEAGRRVPGMGLGLYLARVLVEAHGGSIALLDSSGPGATFELRFPERNES